MSEIQQIRREYLHSRLEYDDLNPDPMVQFRYWLNHALKAKVKDVNVMSLATADQNGNPSVRIVLLKGLDHNGFVFFTNYDSKKGKQIAQNPKASVMFYWSELERQVRIEGRIDKTSRKESDEYFMIRPEGSKIGAWASPQSQRIPNREYLDHLEKDFIMLSKKKPLERPDNWGGYRLIPNLFEFWQGRENRLHDRFEYQWVNGGWELYRLAP
jgi:pyridoxamine 5'-phosphate oxidase